MDPWLAPDFPSLAEPARWLALDAYATVAAVLPLLATLLVTLVCGALFVVLVAFGLVFVERGIYSALIFGLLALASLVGHASRGRLGRARSPGDLVALARVGERRLGVEQVGNKARNLARLAEAGARVVPGWVVPSGVFERVVRANGIDLEGSDLAEQVRAARLPRRLVRRLARRLESVPAERYWLRTSFADEDTEDHAFPGVYESVQWSRRDGHAALAGALKEVWASYFSERAADYRRQAFGSPTARRPRLAVLAQPAVVHDACGVASSADLRTGFRERHLVDVATPGREWAAAHDLLENVVRPMRGADPGFALPGTTVKRISRAAALGEELLDRPAEVEWGLEGERLWIYQLRGLTALPKVETYTNSYLAEMPRLTLTPLSRSFLFGGEPEARLLGRSLARLGLGELEEGDVRVFEGALYLRWGRFKAQVTGVGAGPQSLGAALRLLGILASALGVRGRLRVPPVPEPPDPALDAPELLAALEELRVSRLLPRVERQGRVAQVALLLDGLIRQISSFGQSPTPHVASPLGELLKEGPLDPARPEDVARFRDRLWYLAEREAELSSMRVLHAPDIFMLRLGVAGLEARSAAPEAPVPTSLPVRLLSRWRDRLFTAREQLNVEINCVNFEARRIVEALAARMPPADAPWTLERLCLLSMPELGRVIGGELRGDALEGLLEERAAEQARQRRRGDPPAVIHLGADGQRIRGDRVHEAEDDALCVGIPLGSGIVEGVACVIRSGAWIDPDHARDSVLVLPDPSPMWMPLAGRARAVVFARGGPLSHLALWCKEHRVPTVVAARGALRLVPDGQPVVVDTDAGTVRRV